MSSGGKDIVSEMAREMNLTPAMVESLQSQQGPASGGYGTPGGYGAQGGYGAPGGYGAQGGYGAPGSSGPAMSPEQQIELMAQAQKQADGVPGASYPTGEQEYSDDTGSSGSSESAVSDDDLDMQKLGLEGSQSWLDIAIYYLKTPVVMAIIFAILTIPAVDNFIRPFVTQLLGYNSTYYLLVKAIFAGLLALVAKFAILD